MPDNDDPPPSVVCTLSRILNTEVKEDSAIPRKNKGGGTEATTSAKAQQSVVQGAN